jgi:LPXTG-motif cell wall-anchored protein
MKSQALTVSGAVLVFLGAVWTGQGLGYIRGSFMTGSTLWAVIGSVLVLAGVGLLVLARRRRS